MAHVVRAELDFVTFFGCGVRAGHDAGVIDQDVKACFVALEGGGGRGDGREGSQVQREENDFAGIGDRGFDVSDGRCGFRGSARCEVDARGLVGSEVGDGLLA